MTDPTDIRQRVQNLREEVEGGRGDEETWHSTEDAIWQDALKMIVAIPETEYGDGLIEAQRIAGEAIRTRDLDFSRWYA